MHSRILFVLTAGVAFPATLWTAFRTHAATTRLEARHAAAEQTRDRLSAELQQARETIPPSAASTTSDAAPALPPVPPVSADAKSATSFQTQWLPRVIDSALDNPQLLKPWLESQRAKYKRLYLVLFDTLNFTPVQRERFMDIFTARMARGTDIEAAAKVQGLEFGDPALKKLADDSQQQFEAALLREFGTKNFQAYDEFERSISVRGFVDGFAVQMAMTEPLTSSVAEQVVKALIAATATADDGRHLNPGKVNWNDVDRMAEQFLTPTQLAAWKLGVAHNPAGGSRLDHELRKAYDTARAKSPKQAGS